MGFVVTLDSSFQLLEGETLLEGLERTGHAVEFQCRSGYCGSCRTRLIDGEVRYTRQPLAYVGRNEVLPCCCVTDSMVSLEIALMQSVEQPLLSEEFDVQQTLGLDTDD
ncbi:MAG: class I ribonucleotide reductase maintenance protein YfaE [Pelistega sp.]|nr:class I ribonucleotide reductase maintenance protein YfaE [Pelistega sp.]